MTEFRPGTCSSCGAHYRVPASFQADRARCQSCGGVVEIGPLTQESAAPAPSAGPFAAPSETPSPAKPSPPALPGPGVEGFRAAPVPPAAPEAARAAPPVPAQPVTPSVPSKPISERTVVPPRPVVPAKPIAPPKAAVPPPAAKPVVPPPAAKAPPAKPVVPPSAAAAPAPRPAPPAAEPPRKKREGPSMKEQLLARRAAAEQESASAKPTRASQPAPAKPLAARPSTPSKQPVAAKAVPPTRKQAPARARSSKREDAGDEGAGSARSRRGASARSKRKGANPALLVGSFVGLLVLGGALWFFLLRDTSASSSEALAQAPANAGQDGSAPAGDASKADASAANAGASAEKTPEPVLKDAEGAAPGGEAGAAAEKPKEAPKKKEEAAVDPSSVDLSALPQFGPAEGTSPEQWQEIQGSVAKGFDLNQGAAGNRARIHLEELGKPAVPAVINAMLGFDYASEEGKSQGDLAQRLLTKICNGRNFDWRYTTEPKDVLFNKKVVVAWHTQWDKAKDSEEYWLAMIKAKPGEGAKSEEGEQATQEPKESELDALDDL